MTTEEIDTSSLSQVGTSQKPILERKSDLMGYVKVYPPATQPTEWSKYAWRITTERMGGEDGIDEYIKPANIMECYERPFFISDSMRF